MNIVNEFQYEKEDALSVPEVQSVNVKHSDINTVLIYKNFDRIFESKFDFAIGSHG